MAEDPEEEGSENVGPQALLEDLVSQREDGLVVVMQRKEVGEELEVVEAGVEVVERVVYTCQLLQQLEALPLG